MNFSGVDPTSSINNEDAFYRASPSSYIGIDQHKSYDTCMHMLPLLHILKQHKADSYRLILYPEPKSKKGRRESKKAGSCNERTNGGCAIKMLTASRQKGRARLPYLNSRTDLKNCKKAYLVELPPYV